MPMLHPGIYVAAGRAGSSPWRVPGPGDAAGAPGVAPCAAHFNAVERNRLLLERGIGPITVARLERAGFSSIEALRRAGAHQIVDALAETFDTPGWRNRMRALDRIINQTSA